LKEAFGTNSLQEIADSLQMSYQGLDHLIKGRRKFSDSLLLRIHDSTKCSIHWMLTGEGPKFISPSDGSAALLKRVKEMEGKLSSADRELVERLLSSLKLSPKER
jgi:hypothetical protein